MAKEVKENSAAEVETEEKEVTSSNISVAVAAAETTTSSDTTDNVQEIIIPEDEEKVDNVIKFSKTYRFEGKDYTEIDLSGIENITAMDMQKIEALYRKITKNVSSTPEITLDYALATANVLTDLPIEFLKRISGKDMVKIKTRVVNFLYSED